MNHLRNMMQKKWRTALTITAVAISMALLLSMLSIGEGIQQSVKNEITDSKRDIIVGVSGSVGMEDGHSLANDLLAFDGGGYFRLFPYWFTKAALRRINHKENKPFIFYFHPWEIDPEQPKRNGPWMGYPARSSR